MIIFVLFASLLAGPILFKYGGKNNDPKIRLLGAGLWILGWSYLAWVVWGLVNVAG